MGDYNFDNDRPWTKHERRLLIVVAAIIILALSAVVFYSPSAACQNLCTGMCTSSQGCFAGCSCLGGMCG